MFHFEDILYLFIFSIPLYYFWRWLYKKFISDKTKMLIATLFSTLISTPIVLKGLILLFFIYVSYYPKIDFDRAKWIAEPNKRYQMTESIIQSKMLIGKTKEEVKVLLGSGEQGAYYIGFLPGGFSIDPDILGIQYKNGKVVKVSQ
jgi:hypothetical protein